MSHGSHKHASQPPFVDMHCNVADGMARIEGILPITAIEGLLGGLYVDGSRSFKDEHGDDGVIARILGTSTNQVDAAMQAIFPYLAKMDADGKLLTAYWASGDGRQVYRLAEKEMSAADAAAMTFTGPPQGNFGSGTFLLPALRDFVTYVRERVAAGDNVQKALMTVITDGEFHDYSEIIAYAREMEAAMAAGTLPKIVVSIVGVGNQVSEHQLEDLLHDTRVTSADHATFCFNLVEEMPDLSAIVAHLADVGVVALRGGAQITDSDGTVLIAWEDEVPALVEFEVPVTSGHVFFEAGGQRWEVEIDSDDDHEGEEHHDEPAMAGAAAGHHDDH
ncbi:hypothetical protein KBD09_02395 [Candidatus Woesebacteria bacterium]|nr:hypothetical protein [Candidatus Woesebacteria bacterium]